MSTHSNPRVTRTCSVLSVLSFVRPSDEITHRSMSTMAMETETISSTFFFTRILARALYGALISGIETGARENATRFSESSDVVLKSERLSIASRIVGYRISEDAKELGSYTPRTFNRATLSEAG